MRLTSNRLSIKKKLGQCCVSLLREAFLQWTEIVGSVWTTFPLARLCHLTYIHTCPRAHSKTHKNRHAMFTSHRAILAACETEFQLRATANLTLRLSQSYRAGIACLKTPRSVIKRCEDQRPALQPDSNY